VALLYHMFMFLGAFA